MTHYVKIDGAEIKIEMGCFYPDNDSQDNNCPIGSGDCQSCKYGQAKMSIGDCMKLLNTQ